MEFYLFTTNTQLGAEAIAAGVNGLIVDLEQHGKKARQANFETEINEHSIDELINLRRSLPKAYTIARINSWSNRHSPEEIKKVLDTGVQEIILPMAKQPHEVEEALHTINGQAAFTLLIETKQILDHLQTLAAFPLSRVYVGLNDLGISVGNHNIFQPFADGTLRHIFNHFGHIPNGVAGLTHPSKGYPVPCSLLMNELVALGVSFSYLRRSFKKDVAEFGVQATIDAMRSTIHEISQRSVVERTAVSLRLKNQIDNWLQYPHAVVQNA